MYHFHGNKQIDNSVFEIFILGNVLHEGKIQGSLSNEVD